MLNLSPPPIRIFVGGLEISSVMDDLVIEHRLAEVTSPIVWGGTLTIAATLDVLPESFDDIENPSRWAAGRHPIQVWIHGVHWQTLRIARDGYTYNEIRQDEETTAIAQIQFTDLLGLLDTYTPMQDAPGITIGAGTLWYKVVELLLLTAAAQAGITITVALTVPTDNLDVLTAPLTVDAGSYVKMAQKMAGERLRHLWCDKEVIKWEPYPVDGINLLGQPTILYQRSRKKLEAFWRLKGMEVPVNYQTVSTSCQKASACAADEWPKVFVETGNLLGQDYIKQRTTQDYREIGNKVIETFKTEIALFMAYPKPYSFSGDPTALVTVEEKTKITTIDPADGKVVEEEQSADRAIGMYESFRKRFAVPSWSALLPNCEKRIIRYTKGSNGQLKGVTTEDYFPAFTLFSVNGTAPLVLQTQPTIRLITREEWEPTCGGENFDKIISTYQASPSTTGTANPPVFTGRTKQQNTQPPEHPTRPPSVPLKQYVYSSTAHIDYLNQSAFVPNRSSKTADTLIDEASCQRLAQYYARVGWERHFGKEVSHGYDPTLLNYKPFQIVHVGDREVTRDGLRIVLGDAPNSPPGAPPPKQFLIEYRGNTRRKIPPVPETPPLLPALGTPVVGPVLSVSIPTPQGARWTLNARPPIAIAIPTPQSATWTLGGDIPPESLTWTTITQSQWIALTQAQWINMPP